MADLAGRARRPCPSGADLVLDGVAFALTPDRWDMVQAVALNTALDRVDSAAERRLPCFPADMTTAGPGTAVLVELSTGGVRQAPLVLPVTTGTGRTLVPVPRAVPGAPADGASRDLELVFGPVRLRRLTLGFAGSTVFVAIDAVFTTGPVELALLGLGIGLNAEMRPRTGAAGRGSAAGETAAAGCRRAGASYQGRVQGADHRCARGGDGVPRPSGRGQLRAQ
ncbi:hypothetical protein J1792_25165 [Streptomyces triculaminicus]|uniref:Uncharacterized protein n=1 Tax=Streptomyces triculaminicus TaxID=2816232 RepID=A0A939FSK9_9ACTN|nr:hypothetical protein [Streptomyces triculaminicus]MBO0655938.1 hypothetical protein [Streptomyces triculaminicus]